MKLRALVAAALIALSTPVAQARAPSPGPAPEYGYRVVARFPHDTGAFTEGLLYLDGFIYESTGLEGQSSIRKVRLDTGQVLQAYAIPAQYFGEGMVNWKDRLVSLTWRSQVGFVFDLKTFAPRRIFTYTGEGWSLTQDGKRLIMSDGTAQLRFLDPETLKETGRITVTDRGRRIANLNELEYVRGEVWANIWQTDRIARIDPATGKVVGWIDLTGLLSPAERARSQPDVLNGIAYDAAKNRVFVTGKNWPTLFQIELVRKR